MEQITDFYAYVLGTIAVILLPGPNSLFCLSVAMRYHLQQTYMAILGIIIGDSILILATIFGASTLLSAYPSLFLGLQILGSLYLTYLGIQLLQGAWQSWQKPKTSQTQSIHLENISVSKSPNYYFFQKALLLSLTNPKAILFFLSFFSQFVAPTAPNPLFSFLILATVLQCISFLYLTILAFLGRQLTGYFANNHRLASLGMATVGGMFIGFAVKLSLSNLN